jgi:hypothetical protein
VIDERREMSGETADRAALWRHLGPPAEQVGSVNDPRSEHEGEWLWNEKWVYLEAGRVVRVVLWFRYDLVGVFRVGDNGVLAREHAQEAAACGGAAGA